MSLRLYLPELCVPDVAKANNRAVGLTGRVSLSSRERLVRQKEHGEIVPTATELRKTRMVPVALLFIGLSPRPSAQNSTEMGGVWV